MSRIIASKAPFQRSVMSDRRRPRVLRRARGPLQGRPDRPPREPGRVDRLAVPRPRLRRPLPRPPRPGHGPDRPGQAACRWPAPTGAAARRTRSSPACTRRRSPRRRTWRATSSGSSRPAPATTGASAATSTSSTSTSTGPASRSSCPAGWSWSTASRRPSATSSSRMDYAEIQTPTMLDTELWKTSGHWDNYRENMYFTEVEGQSFAIKPMNCPGACLVYRSRRHSYRELPLRYAEFGHVHRHELSGVLHGLFRVRAFTQDDAHIFCRLDQVQDEVQRRPRPHRPLLRAVRVRARGAEALDPPREGDRRGVDVGPGRGGAAPGPRRPRVRPEGGRRRLLRAEDRLPGDRRDGPLVAARHLPARLLVPRAVRPRLHERRRPGGAAGDDPPGDHRVDRALPRDPDREHRRRLPAVAGAGAGAGAADRGPPRPLRRVGARRGCATSACGSGIDARSESVGRRIRDGELAKIPYLLVVGDKEQEAGTASVRARHGGDRGTPGIAALAAAMRDEVEAG